MSWRSVRLRRLVSATGGSWGTEPEDGEISARCVRGTDFDYAVLRLNLERAPLRGFGVDEFKRRRARRGDLIVEKAGGGEQQPVGRVVLHDADEDVMPTNFAGRLRPAQGVDSRFLCYLLASLYTDGRTISAVKQTTGIQNLDLGALLDNQVRIPAEEEQRGIADFLDAETARIDAVIGKKRQLIGSLKERFEAAVFALVTNGLRDESLKSSGLRWVAQIPEGWGTPALSVNFEIQLGKMLSAESAQGPEQHPYLRNVNVQWDRLDFRNLARMHFGKEDRRRCELRRGDLLICEGGEVGRAAVWPGEPEDCYFQKAIHRARPRRAESSRFLMYGLRAAAKCNVFAVEGNLSTIVHLTGEQLKAHRLPWPPLDEQAEIVGHLDALADSTDNVRIALESQITLLQERRQALITAAVTGELDLAEAG